MRWCGSEMSVEVVIEGRQRADAAAHDRHRMGVAAEALEEAAHLLVHHRVMGHAIVEIGLLRGGRQLAVEQQVAGLEEVAVLGELLDRVAAIEQDAFVAVDIGDLGLAAAGRGEAGIVGEHPGLAVELADVDDVRADRARRRSGDRPFCLPMVSLRGFAVGAGLRVHRRALDVAPRSRIAATRIRWRSPSKCALQDGHFAQCPAGFSARTHGSARSGPSRRQALGPGRAPPARRRSAARWSGRSARRAAAARPRRA